MRATNLRGAIIIFFIWAFLIGTVIFGIWAVRMSPGIRYKNSFEQSEQVEVIGKRIRKYTNSLSGRSGGSRTYFDYIVAFEFPDGSVKELEVDSNSVRDSSIYDAIHEGDTGILIYKEIKNIEQRIKKENMRFDGRLFISFEKDSSLE